MSEPTMSELADNCDNFADTEVDNEMAEWFEKCATALRAAEAEIAQLKLENDNLHVSENTHYERMKEAEAEIARLTKERGVLLSIVQERPEMRRVYFAEHMKKQAEVALAEMRAAARAVVADATTHGEMTVAIGALEQAIARLASPAPKEEPRG